MTLYFIGHANTMHLLLTLLWPTPRRLQATTAPALQPPHIKTTRHKRPAVYLHSQPSIHLATARNNALVRLARLPSGVQMSEQRSKLGFLPVDRMFSNYEQQKNQTDLFRCSYKCAYLNSHKMVFVCASELPSSCCRCSKASRNATPQPV